MFFVVVDLNVKYFWIYRLEEMSNDNQRLQLSIEQKNGKLRSLENKYVRLPIVNPK